MFCHKCGNQVADGAAFCHKCGAKVILGEVPSLSDSIAGEKPTKQSTASDVLMPDAKEKLESAASKEKTYTSVFDACKALPKDILDGLLSPVISKKVIAILMVLAVLFLAVFLAFMVYSMLSIWTIVLLMVIAGGFLLYYKYGRKFIAKYDAHFASKTCYNHLFKLLAIIGSVAYGVLFFFPWVRVIGQDWLALFGFGSVDGFNSIGLLRFVAALVLGFINLFKNQIDINAIDPIAAIVIIIFIGVLISTITSAWGNVKNIFYLIINPDKNKISGTSAGPLEFIIAYYIARTATQSYITDITSDSWIGGIAGNLFGNMFQISAVPLILLLLSGINWYLMKRYICSLTEI